MDGYGKERHENDIFQVRLVDFDHVRVTGGVCCIITKRGVVCVFKLVDFDHIRVTIGIGLDGIGLRGGVWVGMGR